MKENLTLQALRAELIAIHNEIQSIKDFLTVELCGDLQHLNAEVYSLQEAIRILFCAFEESDDPAMPWPPDSLPDVSIARSPAHPTAS